MHVVNKVVLGTTVAAGLLAASALGASAEIACTGSVCWHVHERYAYPPAARVIVHPDNWHMSRRYRMREHEGSGYWRGNQWVVIH